MKMKMKNGEFVEIFNGLTAVQKLKGVKFGLLVAKNIRILKTELNDLEEASKPTEEFLELSQKMNQLMNKKDDDAIKALEKENEALVNERKAQLKEVDALLLEETEIDLISIPESCLPAEISAEQILAIDKVIE
jgi:vacuolar-type H+-ATPase subunit I/STV1|tara:strand:- start:857 stop:1258 length:402 start_codon:yes stop_codon:yes gene_type:complete